MSSKRGYDYENQLVNDLFELSDGTIIPVPAGYSGNHGIPSPDILIPFGGALAAAECKTSGRDNSIIIEPEDIRQLRYWTMKMSEVPVYPYLFIKFRGSSPRLVYVTRLTRLSNPQKAFENEVERCPFDAKVTRTGNLSFRKPPLDVWPSTRGGDGPNGLKDAYHILETMRTDDFDQPSVVDIIRQRDDYFEKMGES